MDFKLLLKGRQAISRELRGASPLSGHQHYCCHILVRPSERATFNEWAAKEAPGMVGIHRVMLDVHGDALPIAKTSPWANPATERLETAVSLYVIATTSASDEVADED